MKKVIYVIGAIIVSITIFLYLNIDSSTSITDSGTYGASNFSSKSNMSNVNDIKNNLPKDFDEIKKEFRSGTFIDMANLSAEYYARPEFYVDYDTYKQGTRKRSGRIGYGTAIIESSYNVYNFSAVQYMDVYTIIRTAPGIDSYQKFGLRLQSPDDKLFETYTDPSNITLSPTYPEITPNWVYKIKMRIISKKDIPKGRYVFKLETIGASIQPEKFFDFILYAYEELPQTVNNKYHK